MILAMSRSTWLMTVILVGTSMVLVQPAIATKSAARVQSSVQGMTVKIRSHHRWGNAITLQDEPQNATDYHNRAFLKHYKLNDVRGALADYNSAITLNPRSVNVYHSRGILKHTKLKDDRGALADYDLATSQVSIW